MFQSDYRVQWQYSGFSLLIYWCKAGKTSLPILSQDQIPPACILKVIGCTGVIFFFLSACILPQLLCHPSVCPSIHPTPAAPLGLSPQRKWGPICSSTPISWGSHLNPMFSRAVSRQEFWGHSAGGNWCGRLFLPWSLLFALWFAPYIGFGVDTPHHLVNTCVTCAYKNNLLWRTFQNTHREVFSLPFLVWIVMCL